MTTPYVDQFASFSANGGGAGPSWLPALRKRAFERFTELGFPTTRNEDWHFTSVTPIAEKTFKALKSAASTVTMADIEREAEHMAWGTADEVTDRIIAAAEHAGAGTVLINMNRGAMPHEMFMRQIRRFGAEVLPKLRAHEITKPMLV